MYGVDASFLNKDTRFSIVSLSSAQTKGKVYKKVDIEDTGIVQTSNSLLGNIATFISSLSVSVGSAMEIRKRRNRK